MTPDAHEDELALFRRISERFGSSLRLEEVLDRIIEEISTLLSADACAFFLRDEKEGDFRLAAARGFHREAVGVTRLALGEGITGWAAQHREIVAAPEAKTDPRYAYRPETGEEEFTSLLAVPIVRGEESVGVITLQTRVRREFSRREIRTAAAVAEQVFFAIENARRYRRIEEQLEEVTRLYEVVRSIGTSLNLPEVLDEILRHAARILSARGGTLRIHSPEDNALHLRASYNLPADYDPDARRIGFGEGVSGLVAETGQAVRIGRAQDDPRYRHLPRTPFQSLLVVPLQHGGKVIGTIGVFDKAGAGGQSVLFSEADERILTILGQHAAEAITHADLYGRVEGLLTTYRRRVQELEILHQISKALQTSQTRDEALFIVLTGVTSGKGLGYNRAIALLLEEGGEALVGAMGIGPTVEEVSRVWAEAPKHFQTLEDYFESVDLETITHSPFNRTVREIRLPVVADAPLPVRAILERRPINCVRPRETAVHSLFVERLRTESFAAIPIWAKDLVVGVLVVDNCFNRRPIEDEELILLETVAHQAGLGLSSVRLVEEVTAAMRRLEETTQKLVEAKRLATIGEVAAGVAHDIRNPLTAIGGFTRRIEKTLPPEHPAHRYLSIVLTEVSRLERLARDVLDLARERAAEWEEVDMRAVVESWRNLRRVDLEGRGISYRFEGDAWRARGDRRLLEQAIGNVLQNAFDALAGGGEVLVVGRRDGDKAHFEIADTGAGMSDEAKEKAFEAFFTTKTEGTGLGLALVQKAMRAHHGEAKIETEKGKGTRVILRWPG